MSNANGPIAGAAGSARRAIRCVGLNAAPAAADETAGPDTSANSPIADLDRTLLRTRLESLTE
jgi:hypothetical protein